MKTSRTLRILAGIAVLFGVLTIISGGQVLFGDEVTRANAGQVIAFVLWFNFCAGFAYVLAVGLLIYIFLGGGYEMRTLVAMALRLGFWVVLARLARQELKTSDNLKRSVL